MPPFCTTPPFQPPNPLPIDAPRVVASPGQLRHVRLRQHPPAAMAGVWRRRRLEHAVQVPDLPCFPPAPARLSPDLHAGPRGVVWGKKRRQRRPGSRAPCACRSPHVPTTPADPPRSLHDCINPKKTPSPHPNGAVLGPRSQAPAAVGKHQQLHGAGVTLQRHQVLHGLWDCSQRLGRRAELQRGVVHRGLAGGSVPRRGLGSTPHRDLARTGAHRHKAAAGAEIRDQHRVGGVVAIAGITLS